METTAQSSPAPTRPMVRAALAGVFGVMAALGWLIFGVLVLVLAPKFRAVFTDFGVALPGMTLFLLGLSARWSLAAGLVVVAAGGSVLAATRGWAVAAAASLVLAGLAIVCFLLAMQLPLLSMTESLGSGA